MLTKSEAGALGQRLSALEAAVAFTVSDAAGATAAAAGAVQRVATAEWRIEKVS